MKKISFLLMAFGLMVTSCTKDDFDYQAYMDNVKQDYNDLFTLTFGEIAPGHDWGFHADNGSGMRAVFDGHWNGGHVCGVDEAKFNFSVPSDAVDLTTATFSDEERNNGVQGAVYKIPETFEGELKLNGKVKFNNCTIYNLGKVTNIDANWEGSVTFYNKGTIIWTVQSGNRHNIINIGTFTLANDANIGTLHNGGTLIITDTDISNSVTINSKGDETIYMPNGGDMKAVCDIHGTLTVGDRDNNVVKNLKIQNSTSKYICGIDCTGKVENVDGPLITSNVVANEFKFDGNPIYLTQGGHVNVASTIYIPNSNCHVYAVTGSTALVESKNFEFGNKNDFTHTFSDNIYFKVNSGYIKCDNCYAMGHNHYFNNLAEYLASDAHTSDKKSDEYALAKDRINAGNASGSPACGSAWSIGTGTPDPDPDPIVYKKRIIAEDLSAGQFRADFDFNDVVFDAVVTIEPIDGVDHYIGYVKVLAAGGTLPLYIGIPYSEDKSVYDPNKEVHKLFGKSSCTMINTGTDLSTTVNLTPRINNIDLGPVGDGSRTNDALIQKINDIPVVVVPNTRGAYPLTTVINYDGEYQTTAPMKIAVPTTYQWTKERKEIQSAYPNFSDYVQNKSPEKWYETCADTELLYNAGN